MTWALDLAKNYVPQGETLPVFGIIVYTDAHPNVKKILRDEAYWAALDEISGPKWPIFSIRAAQGEYRAAYRASTQGSETYAMLIPVWEEPARNKELLEHFELEDTRQLPSLVVFTIGGEDELTRTSVPLSDESPEAAFNRLREVLSMTARAIDGIAEENRSDREGILTAIDFRLRDLGRGERMKKGYAFLKELRDWLPF
jgi:hypothetical protein